jgi:hypothetical protein
MNRICEKIADNVTMMQALGIALISVPGFFIVKDYVAPKVNTKYHHSALSTWCPSREESLLESKVKSENLRAGPAFVYFQSYHNRRTERVKSAYTAVWSLVNQNLDQGNRVFKVAITDDDISIVNVVRRLLIDELTKDGYNANITIHPMNNHNGNRDDKIAMYNEGDDHKTSEYYFHIFIN